jgi:hypothetical protein
MVSSAQVEFIQLFIRDFEFLQQADLMVYYAVATSIEVG